ncbi:MAG: hypothetical protein AAGA68_25630 [Pseudomonadota bacterium]
MSHSTESVPKLAVALSLALPLGLSSVVASAQASGAPSEESVSEELVVIGSRLPTEDYTNADEAAGEEVRRPMHVASLLFDQRVLGERLAVGASVVYNGEQLDNDFRNYFTNNFSAERTPLDGVMSRAVGGWTQAYDS